MSTQSASIDSKAFSRPGRMIAGLANACAAAGPGGMRGRSTPPSLTVSRPFRRQHASQTKAIGFGAALLKCHVSVTGSPMTLISAGGVESRAVTAGASAPGAHRATTRRREMGNQTRTGAY